MRTRLARASLLLLCAWVLTGCVRRESSTTNDPPARYQIASITGGLLVRLDTRTGEMRAYTFDRPDEGYRRATEHELYFREMAALPLTTEQMAAIELERGRQPHLDAERAKREQPAATSR